MAAQKSISRKRRHERPKPRVEPAAREMQLIDAAVPVMFLCVLIALVYSRTLNFNFVWDDVASVIDNLLLRRPGGIWEIWTTIGTVPGEQHYWPVTYTVLWLEWQMWANAPGGYHAVNILLHAAVVIQIWRVMRRAGLPGATLAAAVFAVHPVHVEAVAWVISIKDLLATLFFLIAFECFMNHIERAGWKWLAWSSAAITAAMLSKSSPVVAPAVLAIWIWYRGIRFDRRNLIGISVIAAIVVIITAGDMAVGARLAREKLTIPSTSERIAEAGWCFWFYAAKLSWPFGLSPIYPHWHVNPGRALHWLPLLAIAPVTLGLWLARRRIGRGPLASWLFYGVSLGPILGIIYFKFLDISPAADRYQYLASIGPIAGASVLAARLAEKSRANWRIPLRAGAAIVVLILSGLSWRQANIFQNQTTLFQHALTIAPESPYALWYLGTEAVNQKRNADAEPLLRKAIRYKPDLWGAITNLGVVMIRENRNREASLLLRGAVDRGSTDSGAFSNLAWIMATDTDPQVRNPAMALTLANRCVSEAAQPVPMFLNVQAAALAANGRYKEAVETARKAAALAREHNATQLAQNIEKFFIPVYEKGKPFLLNKQAGSI